MTDISIDFLLFQRPVNFVYKLLSLRLNSIHPDTAEEPHGSSDEEPRYRYQKKDGHDHGANEVAKGADYRCYDE